MSEPTPCSPPTPSRGALTCSEGVTRLDDLSGESFCYLTTLGRRSGRDHTIEIWFALAGGKLYLMAGGGRRADWVSNLVAHPPVTVRIGRWTWSGTARIVQDGDEEALARRLLATKYQGWKEGRPMSRWARTALPVAIEPDDADGAGGEGRLS